MRAVSSGKARSLSQVQRCPYRMIYWLDYRVDRACIGARDMLDLLCALSKLLLEPLKGTTGE